MKNLLRSKPLSWTAVAAWVAAIFCLSALSGSEVEKINVFKLWDKAAHFLAFAAGGLLMAHALRLSTAWSWPKLILAAALAISLYGGADEWHQLYTPKRSGADLGDWVADTLGALSGALALSFFHARYPRKDRPAPLGA